MKNKLETNSAKFRPIPADPKQHLMAISQITSEAFAGGKYIEEISQQYIGNCHYDFETSRLIFDGDELIHHWGVWGYPMRLESVQLQVAGIGAVVTREPFRKRGFMAMAAEDSFKAMLANGYDLSILRGRHYVKFGYARAWNYVTYKLTSEDIPAFPTKSPYETLQPSHLDEMVAIYNHENANFAGTAVRPTYRVISEDGLSAYKGWFNRDGSLAGYVRVIPTEDKKALQCLEATGDPEQGLAVLAELFREGEYETLNFFTIPWQHPILQIIRRGACIVEDRYFLNTGWRVKVINLPQILEKLLPLLEVRLRQSHLMNWRGALQLDGGDQAISLKIEEGIIRVVESASGTHTLKTGAALGRFLIGSDDPVEIIQQESVVCTGDAAELAKILFPNLHPVMSHFDEF